MRPRIWHATPQWQGDELRTGSPSSSDHAHADALRVGMVVSVMSHGVSPTDVDLVLLALARGLSVNGVVEVHALGGVGAPVPPHQIDASADQAENHCGNDRNCMYLTHRGREMGRGEWRGGGSVNKAEQVHGNERHREENRHAEERKGPQSLQDFFFKQLLVM